ncbi:MAG: type II toxin-antitoxin system RelE/ParE family toxin [Planctomycetia bacterium]|nr:type II toxin-antitoxin system RelE/ParE family toxin [Planctomycetia bacterium]
MSRRLVIHALAEADLQESQDWYERKQPGLGAEFRAAVETALQSIRRNPEHFLKLGKGVRRARMSPFPYGIFFRTGAERIEVVAILHDRRSPRRWQSRI